MNFELNRFAYDPQFDKTWLSPAGRRCQGKGAEAGKVRESIGYRKIMGPVRWRATRRRSGVHGTAYGMREGLPVLRSPRPRHQADNRTSAQWGPVQ